MGSEYVLEIPCQQQQGPMGGPVLRGRYTRQRSLVGGVRAIGQGVQNSEGERMRTVYSGLTDAMVKLSWTKLEIIKSKQP